MLDAGHIVTAALIAKLVGHMSQYCPCDLRHAALALYAALYSGCINKTFHFMERFSVSSPAPRIRPKQETSDGKTASLDGAGPFRANRTARQLALRCRTPLRGCAQYSALNAEVQRSSDCVRPPIRGVATHRRGRNPGLVGSVAHGADRRVRPIRADVFHRT